MMDNVPAEQTPEKDDENTNEKYSESTNDELLLKVYKQKYATLDMEKVSQVLHDYFQFAEIKKEQKKCLYAIKNFQHVLNIMPTGGGKSLVYQLMPLLIGGISIVISPLISLIQDQVAFLNKKNIAAAAIHSSMSKKENDKILNQLKGEAVTGIHVLYVTPETATKDPLLSIIKTLYRKNKISLIAIDEAHCISTWGCQFRKSYRNLNVILNACPFVRVYACTATATKRVERDIVTNLGINRNNNEDANIETCGKTGNTVSTKDDCLRIVRCSFNRPNLKYIIIYTNFLKEEERKRAVYNIITDKRNDGKTGIVYCFKRETCEMISKYLREKGISSLSYHAGASVTARKKAQEKWITGRATVLVATIAFGMGIDRQNVSFIIHYNLPKSLENYYQESGRAGRNGNVAFCYLFFSTDEVSKMAFIIKSGYSNIGVYESEKNDICEKELHNLECVNNMCLTDECIRLQILRHFGEIYDPPKKKKKKQELDNSSYIEECDEDYCCSFCDDPYETRNIINSCKQLLYRQTDDYESENSYRNEDSYYDNQYKSEYDEDDEEEDSSCQYKKKKIIYEIPFIDKKKKSKYNSLYCNDATPYIHSKGFQKTNNSFYSANERFLQKKKENIHVQKNPTEISKHSSFAKPKWGLGGKNRLVQGIGETQFKSASTIIPTDTHKKEFDVFTHQLEKNKKNNVPTRKHEEAFDRTDLHPMKKLKKLDTGTEFVAPRSLHDPKKI